ncbi:enhanced intracellular survival protein Eis [Salarchaeum sp. JOR-1]|uniref:GNAT family N-acetyltransferase n=1 Tax=Salarchaeum sp. JOR-1 TaxID=2599399 RepID=UPI00119881D9|nr:GNAT family N-acetyltransferase [Salarchaeum sp. JOR-1]QDX41332.1 GNAT family N-acetyltransferase [Salarchaeum sp. JOR-1]
MVDYRPLPDDRTEEFRSFVTYAFRPESGPHDPDEDDEPPEPAQVGDPYGVFDGDDLLAVCRHYWFTARVRGDTHPMAGLSAVATPPENRRRGLVRDMLAESLREYRDRDTYLSALWPFKHPFYAQFGWATATEYVTHECPPDALAFARDAELPGTWSRLDADDWNRLPDVLAAHGERYELTLDRTEEWWRKRVFRGWDTDPYVYCWRDATGTDRAYVVYRVASDDGKTLTVQDAAWTDYDAYLAILGFLADHDSQVETVRLRGPVDSPLLDVVDDPGEVETTVSAGPMVRLVDVAAALTAFDYPPVDATLTISVSDALADWNDDSFRLTVTDGTPEIERTTADADLALDVGTLTQLAVGHRTIRDLARTRALRADDDTLDTLRDLFPETTTFLREGF